MLTDGDLVLLASMNPAQVNALFKGKSARECLEFRRRIQMAVTAYTKRHPQNRKLDFVQGAMVDICRKVERYASARYFREMRKKLRYDPKGKLYNAGAKIKIKQEWEKFIKSVSY